MPGKTDTEKARGHRFLPGLIAGFLVWPRRGAAGKPSWRTLLPGELSPFLLRHPREAEEIVDATSECLALAKTLRDEAEARYGDAVRRLQGRLFCTDARRLVDILVAADATGRDQDLLAGCVPPATLSRRIDLLTAAVTAT